MTTPGLSPMDMLRRLGSGVRPDGAGSLGQPQAALTQSASFADLLRAAKGGAAASGRTLRLAEGVSAADLSPHQMERLARAADRAEAAGAGRVLALVDGKAVTIDVTTRTALSVADATGASGRAMTLSGIDSVVIVPQEAGADTAHAAPPVRGLTANASLARLLRGE